MTDFRMTPRERVLRKRHRDDFEFYARKSLTIRAKQAVLVNGVKTKLLPLTLNIAQRHIHATVEEQKKKTGRVRALILKGRQQGCSTYVEGRFYWATSHRKGVKTFILTHEDKATTNLFRMAKRYHEHCPDLLRPHTAYSNAKELVFDVLDSAYGVGTAGSKNTGRSDTIDFFHGSEVASWKNAADIKSGIMEAAAMAEEIFLESTAKGFDEMFHPMWQTAEAGGGSYIPIFVPWYWQPEYVDPVPEDFRLTEEEEAYQRLFGLHAGQMAWRRRKIEDLADPFLFKQEYPATAAEAFQVTGVAPHIPPELILCARKADGVEPYGPRVVGVDPARGGDRNAFINRQGRVAWGMEAMNTMNTMAVVGRCKQILDEQINPVARMFIDTGGLGGPLYDRLVEMGYGPRVTAINFGDAALNPERFRLRRSEMWGLMKDWLKADGGLVVSIPDDDELHADLMAPSYEYTSTNQLFLEPKKSMKKRGVRSPDFGDALALTFAEPVKSGMTGRKPNRRRRR